MKKASFNLLCCTLLTLSVIALDQWTKQYALVHLAASRMPHPSFPYGGIPIFENWLGIDFALHFVTNTGAAWGVFHTFPKLLCALRIGMIGALLGYLLTSARAKQTSFALCLILAGATSNVIDYFLHGYVIDMFHFVFWGRSWGIFNLADVAIVLGIALAIALPSCPRPANKVT